MRVIIADDHGLFRDGLRSLLEARGVEVVAEARNGREAVELARQLRPDIVLMDLTMPVMGGLEATRLISAELPDVNVVVLTASEDDADLFEDRKSTRLNSSHVKISYAVFCLKKKNRSISNSRVTIC